jgi:hypothetical protein
MIYNYTLTMQPYYEYINQCYRNILTLNKEPVGPLKSIVKRLNPPKLSEFNQLTYNNECCYERKCIYAIYNLDNKNELMCVDNISNLFEYLINNNYTIDKSLTKIFEKSPVKLTNPMICFISYKID